MSEHVLASEDRGHPNGCGTCRANRGELRAPGGAIYDDGLWRVEHRLEPEVAGWLVVKPLRHVTAFAALTEPEASAFGALMRRVMSALTSIVSPVKIYMVMFSEQEGFEHIHVHVIPRSSDVPEQFRGPGIFDYGGKARWADAEAIAERVRELVARNLTSR